MQIRLWKAVDRRFRESDIAGAVTFLEKRLAAERVARFKGLLGNNFTNTPASILSAINKFVDACSEQFAVRAIYLEMNGFDINPDRWYFDSFAYIKYDPKDVEWLCEWQSPDWPKVTLKGLEPVQADFDWYHAKEVWKEKKYERAYEVSVLLVMVKFGQKKVSGTLSGDVDRLLWSAAGTHDAASRLTSTTNRNGDVINFSYDADNRQTGMTPTAISVSLFPIVRSSEVSLVQLVHKGLHPDSVVVVTAGSLARNLPRTAGTQVAGRPRDGVRPAAP